MMRQMAISIPVAAKRRTAPGAPGRAMARKGMFLVLVAWAVTYGGVLVGMSLMGMARSGAAEAAILVFILTALPAAGIALAVSGIRHSAGSLKMFIDSARTKVASVIGLVVGLSFFVVPVAVVAVVSMWAIG
jgi:hypothetical protein